MRSHGSTRPVVLLIALMSAVGLFIDVRLLHLRHLMPASYGIAFVVFLAAFAFTEVVVLHVELGKNAHSVSLAELTLTIAFFFLPAGQLPIARVIGGATALLLVRRQRPLKLAFNTSVWVLDAAVATIVYRALEHTLRNSGGMMLAGAAAALTAALIDSIAVNVVIATTSHEVDLGRALRFVRTCMFGAMGCAAAGVVCVGAIDFSYWLLLPIVGIIGLLMYAFHLFGALRTQHTNVKVLYDFAGELALLPHGQSVVRTVLSRVRELLRAEHAAVYLVDKDSDVVTVTSIDTDGRIASREVPRTEISPVLLDAVDRTQPLVVQKTEREDDFQAFLSALSVRDAVLAPLTGAHDVRGVMVISNRLGEFTTFTPDDGLLLQTLTSHAAAAFANSRLVQQLNYDSMHDSLTGLANRALFQDRAKQVLLSPNTSAAVLLMDLDRFKEVNDTLGHHHGDLLLQEIAARLSRELRTDDLLARLGGDEFAVLMTDLTPDAAVATAERLRIALAKPMRLQGVEMEVAASIGVVHIDARSPHAERRDATVLLQQADVAMYTAKQHYSGVHVYQDELDGYSPRRLALAGGLRAAIEQGQLSLRFQPQAAASDGTVVGAEALVRWEHQDYGTVAPDDFISIAEQTGQIRELTRFVLDQALAQCRAWSDAGHPLAVSVNLSVRNLMEADLVDAVAELLTRHGVPGHQLTLEVTESHLMADPSRMADVLAALTDLGVRLSVDDFGTGYSSLAYLKQLPVSEVKIDKSFIRGLGGNSEDAAIVEAIIQLAHTLRLDVVAEGVEDAHAQQRLRALRCDTIQGYHLARPMHADDFHSWLCDEAVPQRRVRLHAVPEPRSSEPNREPLSIRA